MNTLSKINPAEIKIDLDKELGIYIPSPKPERIPTLLRTSKLFLKGPIPFDWLKVANSLGGSTGIIATGLWLYVGLTNSKRFKIDSKLDQFAGVTRQTRQNALQKLQQAGLVQIIQSHGAYPFIEVIPVA
jgi:hypothetical protein